MPDQTPFRINIKYAIVSRSGDILWLGQASISAAVTLPEDEKERALFLVQAAEVIRDSTPDEAPIGRVIILAAIPERV